MARIEDNWPDIRARLQELPRAFHLNRPYQGKTLGDAIFDEIARLIYVNTVVYQREPSGAPLAPLATATLERKALLGLPATILVERHEMMSPTELAGVRSVGTDSASVTYGVSDFARLKMDWNTRGSSRSGRPKRPPRPSFEIPDTMTDRLDAFIATAGDEIISSL